MFKIANYFRYFQALAANIADVQGARLALRTSRSFTAAKGHMNDRAWNLPVFPRLRRVLCKYPTARLATASDYI